MALCRREDFLVDRLELIHGLRATALAEAVERDIGAVSPETRVVRRLLDIADPWDFEEVYSALHDLLRALEERRFLPMGADREVSSDFQLIAGTNRELGRAVAEGRFREDLLARINLWTFELPPLRARPEDIEPNLDFELDAYANRRGQLVRFNREARRRFLDFATSPAATWAGNFRDLSAAVTRMATLAPGGRITEAIVAEEIGRLVAAWAPAGPGAASPTLPAPTPRALDGAGAPPVGAASPAAGPHASPGDDPDTALLAGLLGPDGLARIDLFDRVQLAAAVRVCRESRSLSEAGRRLFAASRTRRSSTNDSDRVRKYLGRYGLDWDTVCAPRRATDDADEAPRPRPGS